MDASPDNAPPTIRSGRMTFVVACACVALLALVGRVAYLQTTFAQAKGDRVDRQHQSVSGLAARRGSIFDRNGLLLAGTTLERNVFVDPKFLHDEFLKTNRSMVELDDAVDALAARVSADADRVALRVTGQPNKRYVPLRRQLSAAEAADVVAYSRDLGLRGVATEPQPQRTYTMASLAAHVIGTVGRDGDGLEGIERRKNAVLSGENGKVVTIRDKRRRAIAAPAAGVRAPQHGQGVILTIDARLQQIVEEELAATVEAFDAVGGSCVLIDPHTGDVLAWANVPVYDPQFPGDFPVEYRRNRAIVDPYEPGSVVKPFLMAQMFEADVTSPGEVLTTGKTTRLPVGRRVTDDYGYEQLNSWDVVVKSSNIGMAKTSGRMTYDAVVEAYERFGFGERTNVGLDGEHGGLLYQNPPDKYTQSSMAFGYAMMATPAQLARAIGALANGGDLLPLRLVAGTVGHDGTIEPTPRQVGERALSQKNADLMRRIMADVFVRGTARHARSDLYNLFGKTGTAHQSEGGRQSEEKYFASFVGGGPFENPRLVLAVTVDEPRKDLGYHGGQVAGGTSARILERSLLTLGVPYCQPLAEPPESLRESLHNYAKRWYEPKRTLKEHPSLETTPALEAAE
jgi:cell division protein FtsI (penicillin-binding protein 3)